jgi:hypothetical protein
MWPERCKSDQMVSEVHKLENTIPFPPPWEEEYQPVSFGGKNMKGEEKKGEM